MDGIGKYLRPVRFEIDPTSRSAADEWIYWRSTFNSFLESHGEDEEVSPAIKLKILINHVSSSVYKLIKECKTLEDALKRLDDIYIKPKNQIYARHLLATRQQQPNESISQYLRILEDISIDCEFKAVTAEQNKKDYIRDAFIAGLSSNFIRQRLLEEITMDLEMAFNKALSLENAQLQSASFSASNSLVNALSSYRGLIDKTSPIDSENIVAASKFNNFKCFFCGGSKHQRQECPALNVICRNCQKRGHFSKVCRGKAVIGKSTASATTAADDILSHIVSTASNGGLEKAIISAKINNRQAKCLIDTGSTSSFINLLLVKQCKIPIMPSDEKVNMASISLTSQVEGSCNVSIEILDYIYKDIKLLIIKDLCADIIIGHDILKNHQSLEISFGGSINPLKICSVAQAIVPPAHLFNKLSPDCRPIAIKSIKHSPEDLQFINDEVNNLLLEGIIEESNSSWRAQVLVTKSSTHKKRMVINYAQTINRFTELDAYPLPNIEDIISKISKYSFFSTIDLKSAYHQIPICKKDRPYTAFEAAGNLYQFTRIPFGVTNGVAAFQRVINSIIQNEQLQGTYSYLDDVTIGGKTQNEHDINLNKFLEVARKYQLTLNEEKSKFSLTSINLLGYNIENNTIRPDPDRLRPLLELDFPSNQTSLRRVLGMFSHYAKWIPRFSTLVQPLIQCKNFPISSEAAHCFNTIKSNIAKAFVSAINDKLPFVVETDASEFAIAATLSQDNRPVAFFSRTLSETEKRHSAVEKEAYAIVEALRKWRHYLIGRPFTLITDQKSVTFMFHAKHPGKIKNDKILRWRLELSSYKYDIIYRPGELNNICDTLSRAENMSNVCAYVSPGSRNRLFELHQSLCHPGITRMTHWVRSKNLPYSTDEIRKIILSCPVCSEVKPRFYKIQNNLIKATKPFERLSLDFKGPLPSTTHNKYLLTVIDEYSRFPFAFPCKDVSAASIIKHLSSLFSLFGLPSYVHSDRGSAFMSQELREFLQSKGVATSRTTAYNPQGNGQIERENGIIWKTIQLTTRSKSLKISQWELVLPEVLHSIGSLLCTATNATPHERMFLHSRRSTNGQSLPSWLSTPGTIFMRKHNRSNKYEPLVEEVELLEANPDYSYVPLKDGKETTVSNRHLAPKGDDGHIVHDEHKDLETPTQCSFEIDKISKNYSKPESLTAYSEEPLPTSLIHVGENNTDDDVNSCDTNQLRRSNRIRQTPKYLSDYYRF